MNRTGITVYLVWALILVGAGSYVVSKISDKNDPSSLTNQMKKFNEVLDEDSEVP